MTRLETGENWTKYQHITESKISTLQEKLQTNTVQEKSNCDGMAKELTKIFNDTVDELCPLIHKKVPQCNNWFNGELKELRKNLGKSRSSRL